MKATTFLIACLAAAFICNAQTFYVHSDSVPELNGSGIRGMSVVDDSVAWICGSKGVVARTVNGGRSWERIQLPAAFSTRDIRSVDAFDEDHAYIANAGDSATLLYTPDGGASWRTVYKNTSKEAFFDATAWWDKKLGVLAADPVNGVFAHVALLQGNIVTPTLVNNQAMKADSGEACFAASGTCLRVAPEGLAWIVTGGKRSRLFYSRDYGSTWSFHEMPLMAKGKSSQGAFSVAFIDSLYGVVVGGDYANDKEKSNNCAITFNGGKKWIRPKLAPGGYRSCVEHLYEKIFICTGTSGTDVSYDGGITWMNIDQSGFNVVRKAKRGKLILIAGDKGRVGIVREIKN